MIISYVTSAWGCDCRVGFTAVRVGVGAVGAKNSALSLPHICLKSRGTFYITEVQWGGNNGAVIVTGVTRPRMCLASTLLSAEECGSLDCKSIRALA